jgi:diaminopimelate decarboxylase
MVSPEMNSLLPRDCVIASRDTRIGRWSVSALASAFGTPLYMYDAVTLRENAREVREAFAPLGARVSFAAKACSTIGVLRSFQRCGLDVDVVSEGEMVAAIRAGFRPEQMHLHGNCKSDHELQFAVRTGIRAVVVDSADELVRIAAVAKAIQRVVSVMIRVSLPLETETHPSLQTSGRGSKFGVIADSDEENWVTAMLLEHRDLAFVGLHTHLGSQITDPNIYRRAAGDMVHVVRRFADAGLRSQELSMGGGWAVAYTPEDLTLSAPAVADAIAEGVKPLDGVRTAVEPGRALVAGAALAVYRVGAVKIGLHGRMVAVDGGMGDNPRPALYNARYTAFLPDRPLDTPTGEADIVGRYCESGDVLARAVPLPEVSMGDLVCIPVSGAYQLSMASSYNLVPQPASVIVDGRDARLMTRRATINEMLSREVGYSDWKLD